MGWSYPYHTNTRRDSINDLTKSWKQPAASGNCIAHCLSGNVLWTVWEVYHKDTGSFNRYIGCDLLQKFNVHGGTSWGHKSMDESVHPYYYSCPEKYLNMKTQVLSKPWREGVRAYHTDRRACAVQKRVWARNNKQAQVPYS